MVMLAVSAVGAFAQTIPPEKSTASCEGSYQASQNARVQDSQTQSPTGLGQTFVATKTGTLTRAQVLIVDDNSTITGIPDRSSLLMEIRPLTSDGSPSNSIVLASDVIEANEISDSGTPDWATGNFASNVTLTAGQGYAVTLSPRNGTTIIGWAGAAGNLCPGEVFTSMGGGFQKTQ